MGMNDLARPIDDDRGMRIGPRDFVDGEIAGPDVALRDLAPEPADEVEKLFLGSVHKPLRRIARDLKRRDYTGIEIDPGHELRTVDPDTLEPGVIVKGSPNPADGLRDDAGAAFDLGWRLCFSQAAPHSSRGAASRFFARAFALRVADIFRPMAAFSSGVRLYVRTTPAAYFRFFASEIRLATSARCSGVRFAHILRLR